LEDKVLFAVRLFLIEKCTGGGGGVVWRELLSGERAL